VIGDRHGRGCHSCSYYCLGSLGQGLVLGVVSEASLSPLPLVLTAAGALGNGLDAMGRR
jgi:hypothetical protein